LWWRATGPGLTLKSTTKVLVSVLINAFVPISCS
jgi:hypothetical protein